MKTLLALAAASSLLLACSGGDSASSSGSSSSPSEQGGTQAPADTTAQACPTSSSSSSGATSTAGPMKTPSPTDACDGEYQCVDNHSNHDDWWLHFDGKSCFLGSFQTQLFPNGTAHDTIDGDGTWHGDVDYFEASFPDKDWSFHCNRVAQK